MLAFLWPTSHVFHRLQVTLLHLKHAYSDADIAKGGGCVFGGKREGLILSCIHSAEWLAKRTFILSFSSVCLSVFPPPSQSLFSLHCVTFLTVIPYLLCHTFMPISPWHTVSVTQDLIFTHLLSFVLILLSGFLLYLLDCPASSLLQLRFCAVTTFLCSLQHQPTEVGIFTSIVANSEGTHLWHLSLYVALSPSFLFLPLRDNMLVSAGEQRLRFLCAAAFNITA